PVRSRTAARIFTSTLLACSVGTTRVASRRGTVESCLRDCRGRELKRRQLVDGDVAAHQVVLLDLHERGLGLVADRADPAGTAIVEDTARGRIGCAWNVALEADPLAA